MPEAIQHAIKLFSYTGCCSLSPKRKSILPCEIVIPHAKGAILEVGLQELLDPGPVAPVLQAYVSFPAAVLSVCLLLSLNNNYNGLYFPLFKFSPRAEAFLDYLLH